MPKYTPIAPARQDVDDEYYTALVDKDRKGRPRPWHQHKQEGQVMAAAFDLIERHEKAARVRGCADWLTFEQQPDGLHLRQAYFCRVRLCPMCQWRRSLKLYGQTMAIVQKVQQERQRPLAFILLTLTQRNVPGDELDQELTLIHQAWQRLSQRQRFTKAVKGWMRATEITYNPDSDTFHPHMHAILAVNKSYFTSRDYIPQKEWITLWQSALRIGYKPSVNVKRIRSAQGEPGDIPEAGAIAEMTKYTAKARDFLDPVDMEHSGEVLAVLDDVCKKRRFVAWGGILKAAHQALGLDDAEDGDLVHTETEAAEDSMPGELITWAFYAGPRLYLRRKKGAPEDDTPGQAAP